MTQNSSSPGKIDQILMSMAIHNLKKSVAAVGGVMSQYSREANIKLIDTKEAQYIADRVADMQHFGIDMLLCVDELVATMEKANLSVDPFMKDTQLVGDGYPIVQQQSTYVLANGKFTNGEHAGEMPVSPHDGWNL